MRLTGTSCAVLLAVCIARAGAASEAATSLEHGYQLMYAFDFASAEQVFGQWRAEHPGDPLAPMSQATNLLFSELYRSGILQAQLFVGDGASRARNLRCRRTCGRGSTSSWPMRKPWRRRDSVRMRRIATRSSSWRRHSVCARTSPRSSKDVTWRRLVVHAPGDAGGPPTHRRGARLCGRLPVDRPRPVHRGQSRRPDAVGAAGRRLQGRQAPGHAESADHRRRRPVPGPFARILLAIAYLREHDTKRARDLLVGLDRDFPSNPMFARELQRLASKAN